MGRCRFSWDLKVRLAIIDLIFLAVKPLLAQIHVAIPEIQRCTPGVNVGEAVTEGPTLHLLGI